MPYRYKPINYTYQCVIPVRTEFQISPRLRSGRSRECALYYYSLRMRFGARAMFFEIIIQTNRAYTFYTDSFCEENDRELMANGDFQFLYIQGIPIMRINIITTRNLCSDSKRKSYFIHICIGDDS